MSAHRALPFCTGSCDQGRRDCACPTGRHMAAEAATEIGAEPEGEPLTRYESWCFWLTVNAAFLAFMALVLWAWKP